jgi:RNA polymerase sigma-70 factor (ECF subfamily)
VQRIESSAADVHRFVARRVANPVDAADIAQQTLLVACAKLDTCRGDSVLPWLFTIARHQIVDHYRVTKRVRFVEAAALAEIEPALQTQPDVVQVAYECRQKLGTWLSCITRRLRLEEQVAVLLADVYGHCDKDSAELLEMSVPSFKLLLHAARARLREIAGGKCALVGDKSASERSTDRHACAIDCGHDGPRATQHSYRLAATRRLGVSRLLSLRARLLKGMSGTFAGLSAALWPAAEEGAILALAEALAGAEWTPLLWQALSILAG